MFTDKEILDIIHQKIKTDEKLGDQSGSSGHMGYISYELIDHSTKQLNSNHFEINYNYNIYIETEFTYYPDNPPMEYCHNKSIIIDKDKNLIT